MSKIDRRPRLTLSQEAISRQSGDMFTELSDTFEGLMQLSIIDQNDINQSQLSKIVRKYTGMDVTFKLHENTYDAYCHFVEVDKNHAFFHQRNKLICYQTNNYKTTKTEAVGAVDLRNGTVSGVFSKFPIKIGIGSMFIVGLEGARSPFDADEVAAIMIHELGHAFTTFEYLGKTVMTGLVIGSAVRETTGITEPSARAKVIMQAANNANMHIDEAFIEKTISTHGNNADVILLTEHVKNLNVLSKTNIYDARNCEQIADQFAVKHGAAAKLGAALEKLHKFSYDINYRSTFMYVTLEVMKFVGLFFLTAVVASSGLLGVGLALVILLSCIPADKIYDDPKDRLIFLKRQVIDDLKKLDHQKVKNKELIATLVESIEDLESRIEDVKDRKGWGTAIWDVITPWGRNREQQEAKAKILEESINNDLYTQAAKLATL